MNISAICRLCLSQNVRMHNIANTQLQQLYEKLCNIPLVPDCSSHMACYICHSLLQRSHRLQQQCILANNILQLLQTCAKESNVLPAEIDRTSQTLSHKLVVSQVELTDYTGESVDEDVKNIKQEGFFVPVITGVIKDEPCHLSDVGVEERPYTDSEDDVPLKSISIKKDLLDNKQIHRRTRKRKKNEKHKSFSEDYAKEIILTEEQQIEALNERSKSENYISSPYKCHLCFKGFVNATAFDNHNQKHDESSGTHECDICHMRYSTGRQLRTHTLVAHSRRYVCNKCGLHTHTANQAREHEKWHKGYTYECQLCSDKFCKPSSYLTHVRKRHASEYVCARCGRAFVSRHGLRMHTLKAHAHMNISEVDEGKSPEGMTRRCVECDILFASTVAYTRHVLTSAKHTLDHHTRSTCAVCSTPLLGSSHALAHMKTHARTLRTPPAVAATANPTSLRHTCEQCGSIYGNRAKLQMHIKRVHLGLKYNKNIVCEVCGKKCTSNASLRYHQRTHTGERPHACATCDKRFADTHQLRMHSRTHTGERPYACDRCHRRFTQRPALSRHYRVHTGVKPYVCTYCTKTFSQSNSLKLHVRSVHLKIPPTKKGKQNNVVKTDEAEKAV